MKKKKLEKIFTKEDKVLFIIHDVYQEDNRFPLGVAYLSAVLDEKGAYVEAYCMDVFHYTNEELAEHLQKNRYDLIGVGFLAARFKETIIDLCKVINKNKKDAWLVLGGQGASPIPEYILRKVNADIVMIGEAENSIVDLLECKITNSNLIRVDGIAFEDDNKFKITNKNKVVKDLDSLPFPLWNIFPMDKYLSCVKGSYQEPYEKRMDLVSSRGCINKCNFCYRLEKGIRFRSVANVVEEIKTLKERYGVNYFSFLDELFVISKKRLLEFEKALNDANLKIKFGDCDARANMIDEDTVDILKRCGCQSLIIGFESSNDKVLKLMNKHVTVEENVKALKVLKKAEMHSSINFIWNNFGDDEESLKKNVELIKKYNTYRHCRTIRPVTPYPGSDLYYKLIEMGELKDAEDFFERFKNSDLMTVNLMDVSDEEAYKLLLEANKDLIMDYYEHTGKDVSEAMKLIKEFEDLYSGEKLAFRGARSEVGD